jgi:hypothetical protein
MNYNKITKNNRDQLVYAKWKIQKAKEVKKKRTSKLGGN